METILILIGLLVYFAMGGYISKSYRTQIDMSIVILWPAFLAGAIGILIRAKQYELMARKRSPNNIPAD